MTDRDESKASESETPNKTKSASNDPSEQPNLSVWEEFCFLMLHEKRWWIVPVLIAVTILVLAVALSQSTTVPFIYKLF